MEKTEIVVVGGNTGGCAAAICAARMGAQVTLLEASATLGGINSSGAFGFDAASPQALAGVAEEVAARIKAYYDHSDLKDDPVFSLRQDQVWESHVAARVWRELCEETDGLTIKTGAVLTSTKTGSEGIVSIGWKAAVDPTGKVDPNSAEHTLSASIFIDASYEADLVAWSGANYSLGREGRSLSDPHGGIIYTNNLTPSPEGWLANSVLPGSTGEVSDNIMAFASRLHCRLYDDTSDTAKHRITTPPPGYNPDDFAWTPVATSADGTPEYFNTLYVLVNGKYCLNRLVKGNNLASVSRDYIEAHPHERNEIFQQFVNHALCFLYYVQTEGGYPQLGLAHDEFEDNGNVPYRIYVRSGRRLNGVQTLTEKDMNPFIAGDGIRAPLKTDAIASGDWTFESHGCEDELEPGKPYPEGFFFNRIAQAPYQIPYGALLSPDVSNLIVAGAISTTSAAFCGFRTEATRLHVGMAAGIAAGLALRNGSDPHDIEVSQLQSSLIEIDAKLVLYSDVESNAVHFRAIQWAGSKGYVPYDEAWRFFPDRPATWADIAEAAVKTLRIPISVSGRHFEHLQRTDRAFRYFEALYDFGSSKDIDFFGVKTLKGDLFLDFLRGDVKPRLIPLRPNDLITEAAGSRFIRLLAEALETCPPTTIDWKNEQLTHGAMCQALRNISENALRTPEDD